MDIRLNTAWRRQRLSRRSGVLSVELILVLPILLIFTVGIVVFGLLFARLEQVALAARTGAMAASEDGNLSGTNTNDPVPASTVLAVTKQLSSSGLQWCRIRLEHNVDGTPVVLISEQGDGCDCGPTTTLTAPPFDDDQYVRLTVCVPLSELAPGTLRLVGVSFADKACGFTNVRRVEP